MSSGSLFANVTRSARRCGLFFVPSHLVFPSFAVSEGFGWPGVTAEQLRAGDLPVTDGVVRQHRRCLLHHRLPGVSADAAA